MADFLTNLWTSVFTPGTTPTLLVATNATFAALQLVLAALLLATYSIHFLILSVLCSGLWWSINWFASELAAAQAKEEEAERLRKKAGKRESDWKVRGEVGDSADDEGEDTEVEGAGVEGLRPEVVDTGVRAGALEGRARNGGMLGQGGATTTTTALQPAAGEGTPRARKVSEGDRSGEISTDSEWEKVEQDR